MTDRPGEGYIHRYNELVKALTGAKGGEPMHELAAELLPVLCLESDRPEWWFLSGTTGWTADTTQAAGAAGTFAEAQYGIPAGQKVIGVLIRLVIRNPIAGTYTVRSNATPIAQPASSLPLDLRTGSTRGSALLRGVLATAVAKTGAVLCTLNTQVGVDYNVIPNVLPFVIVAPGTNMTVWQETAVQPLQVEHVHYERAVEEAELTASRG